jgi:hypothetical protein
MIIGGSGSGVCIAGEAGMRDCPICQNAQRFDLTLQYSYAHIWYVFSWITRRKYLSVCSRCHNGVAISKREFQERVPKDPIPFMRRRGWLLIPVIVGAFVLFGAWQEARQPGHAESAVADLQGSYREAVTKAVRLQWLSADDTPALPCKVRVAQQPGGTVTRVDVEPDCPYSDAGKRSVVNAVWRADPLPYKGYEKVFDPSIVITFAPMTEAPSTPPLQSTE